ncbi:branched-chain amino acid ABC transporter permease [Paraburkholderia ferrariae]|uniref:branched-chain amino acid ABC transporter permease n=1 Tax=Paraburkholderia ferrariae TaxID=386056 RepID=UPI0004823502|nr:branched-chain amino acid ABC transporter permease [Paraburkholderia ferrariae]
MSIDFPQLALATLTLASIYALVALGLNLIYGTMRLLNVAHGEIMTLGGYFTFACFTRLHLSPIVSIPLAMVFSAGLGVLCYYGLFSWQLRSPELAKRLESNSLLVFFGLSTVLQNVIALAFTSDPRSYSYLDQVVSVGGTPFLLNRLVILLVGAIATLSLMCFFRFSMAGLAVRALIQQRDAAALVGINAQKLNRFVFSLGFAVAALAGGLISMSDNITPFSGFPYTISAFVVIILGGLGSLGGGVLGALALALVEVFGSALTSPAYRSILVYGLFVTVLLLRPQGLFGKRGV